LLKRDVGAQVGFQTLCKGARWVLKDIFIAMKILNFVNNIQSQTGGIMNLYLRQLAWSFLSIFVVISFLHSTHATAQFFEVEAYKDRCGGLTIYGEYLYWKVVQDHIQYAAVLPGGAQPIVSAIQGAQNGQTIEISEKLSIIEPCFKYESGFRIGLGYEVPCSNWNFQLSWTRLHERIRSRVFDENFGIIPLAIPAGSVFGFINRNPSQFGFANEARSQWRFKFDTIDFDIGRDCSFSNCFSFCPFIGLKAACIKQDQCIDYLGFVVTDVPVELRNTRKNHFRGIGPSFGFNSAWEFCSHWNLSSSLCGALLYGKFNVSEHPSAMLKPSHIRVDLRNSRKHRLRPTVDGNIGIDWNTCICEGFHLMVGVYYEVQYWWNQWQAPTSFESSLITGGTSPQGDLMMQGLTAELALSF
jgi:Legionella pneumophila major outer membrane protein precursor